MMKMSEIELRKKNALRLFLVITIGLSIVWEILIILMKAMGLAAFLMWTPALAAFIVKRAYFPNEKGFLGFRRCKIKYIVASVLIPLIYIGVPYIIYWLVFPGTLKFEMSAGFWVILVLGIPMSMITAIGEEIGWRGFMVPAFLEKIGLKKALLLSGTIWALWHMPILVSGLYMPGTPAWYKVPMFFIIILGCGVIIGILTIQSKSIWPAVVLHAAHNDFDQALFGAYTIGDQRMYYVSETGIITAIIVWAIAIILYQRIKKEMAIKEQGSLEKAV